MLKEINHAAGLTFWRIATVPAFLISAMLTYLLVEYSICGAQALESKVEMQALAALVAIALAVSQIAGSAYASLLAGQRLVLRCISLRGLAYFICAVEFLTTVGMQLSSALGADMVQTQVSTREDTLKARIQRLEESAREKREGAMKQEKVAKDAYELHLASKQRQSATADENKIAALHEELKTVQSQKAPTFVGALGQVGSILGIEFNAGKAFAILLIVSRCFGLCAGSLLFAELGGALWRRGLTTGQATGLPFSELVGPVKPAAQKVGFVVKLLRWMGVLTGGATAVAAPAVRAEPVLNPPAASALADQKEPAHLAPAEAQQAKPATSEPAQNATFAPAQVQKQDEIALFAPAQVQKLAETAHGPEPEPVQDQVQVQVQDEPQQQPEPEKPVRNRPVRKKVPPELRDAIKSGRLDPSQNQVKTAFGCNWDVAKKWLQDLSDEGLLDQAPHGRWKLREVKEEV